MLFANTELDNLADRLIESPISDDPDLIDLSLGEIDQLLSRYRGLVWYSELESTSRLAIEQAIEVIFKHHGTQLRKDGTLYVAHPLEVSGCLLDTLKCSDPNLVVAGLLHDVLEDVHAYRLQPERIRYDFGDQVADIVVGMTNQVLPEEIKLEYSLRLQADLGYSQDAARTIVKHFEYRQGIIAKIRDPRVMLVKSADLVSNAFTLPPTKESRMSNKYLPVLDLFLDGFAEIYMASDELGVSPDGVEILIETFEWMKTGLALYARQWQHYEAQQRAFNLLIE
tara:strand:+ start:4325 stop:5170 length:846 start_codon:yes stop_codon:yes gene_type:complete